MDANYNRAREIIRHTHARLTEIINESNYQGLENAEACRTLESLMEELENAEQTLSYLRQPVREGVLELEPTQDRYFIAYDDGKESYTLTCGESLEALIDGEWEIGRVEYGTREGIKGYYFYGDSKPLLFRGMRVRKREL